MNIKDIEGEMSDYSISVYREMADAAESLWEDNGVSWIGKAKSSDTSGWIYFFRDANVKHLASERLRIISSFSFLDYY